MKPFLPPLIFFGTAVGANIVARLDPHLVLTIDGIVSVTMLVSWAVSLRFAVRLFGQRREPGLLLLLMLNGFTSAFVPLAAIWSVLWHHAPA